MKRIYQTRLGATDGNCFQAGVASVLEMPLDDVPDFMVPEISDWWGEFAAWLRPHGLTPLSINTGGNHWSAPAYYLMGGQTNTGANHVVVMYDGTVVHDPYPGGAPICRPLTYIVFIKTFEDGWSA